MEPQRQQFTYDPADFASEEWAEQFAIPFDDFIELRIKGVDKEVAIITAFEMIKYGARLHNVAELSLAAEANPYFRKRFEPRLKDKKPDDLWDGNKALNALLKLVESATVRDSTRLNAIKELNVLLGITELDEKGQTKLIDKSLADFYSRRIAMRGDSTTTH
ncbi:hypothetical protein EVC45_02455 [Paraburkholderia sp. UYCP14C]|uniref:hypothetical protein n=1 Tax=Paraburkholderia sp. UYCP14C TaxID=2511130 RepID=UPI0010226D84|nr:hypothetical protein [Paraburkholderia sp. UYCP14C]RZF31334.1 hypothetical protein EVC45_02455 [Paraburkholderia sp. UYCP14C]